MSEVTSNTDWPLGPPKHTAPPTPPKPPIQLTEKDLIRMTPEEIDAAFERLELHTIMGGRMDDGWPVDGKGRRLLPPGPGLDSRR